MSTDETSTEITETEHEIAWRRSGKHCRATETRSAPASGPAEAAPLWKPSMPVSAACWRDDGESQNDSGCLSPVDGRLGYWSKPKVQSLPVDESYAEQCEDEMNEMRRIGAAAEIQGAGRVPSTDITAIHGWV